MSSSSNKKFWIEFIDIYRSLPSLWNTNDEGYNNRASRSLALNKLVEKLQEVEPDANEDLAKRKINAFRASFNREIRKIRLAQKELSTEVYSPTLWYFDKLSFLLNQEKVNNNSVSVDDHYDEEITLMGRNAKNELIENYEMYAESVSNEDTTDNDTKSHYGKVTQTNRDMVTEREQNPLMEYTDIIEVPQRESTPESITTPRGFALTKNRNRYGNMEKTFKSQKTSISKAARFKRSKPRLKSQGPYSSYQCQSNLSSAIFTDEAAIYGQAWACGFRKLSHQQQLFAKKAIDEILTLGQLKALKLNTVPINANLLERCSYED